MIYKVKNYSFQKSVLIELVIEKCLPTPFPLSTQLSLSHTLSFLPNKTILNEKSIPLRNFLHLFAIVHMIYGNVRKRNRTIRIIRSHTQFVFSINCVNLCVKPYIRQILLVQKKGFFFLRVHRFSADKFSDFLSKILLKFPPL